MGGSSTGSSLRRSPGVDSSSNASLDDTVRGFEGDVLGEFYGPEAEESGGVLRAVRAADSRVLMGSFGGKRVPELDPSIPEGGQTVPSVGVNRDYTATTVELTDDAEVTAIESDGADGFHVTYRIDGADHRVHLTEQLYFNRYDLFALYARNQSGFFGLGDETGSFTGTPEFGHFNVYDWSMTRYASDGARESTQRGFVVYGTPTETTDLPAGTATYEGRSLIRLWPPDNPRLDAHVAGEGRLTLNADLRREHHRRDHRPDRGRARDR